MLFRFVESSARNFLDYVQITVYLIHLMQGWEQTVLQWMLYVSAPGLQTRTLYHSVTHTGAPLQTATALPRVFTSDLCFLQRLVGMRWQWELFLNRVLPLCARSRNQMIWIAKISSLQRAHVGQARVEAGLINNNYQYQPPRPLAPG